MLMLGIDPSLRSTGWGIVGKKEGKIHYIASGIITPSIELVSDFDKILFIASCLEEIMAQYHPTIASIEETFMNSNARTSLKLGIVRGAIILTVLKYGIKIKEISPNLVKKSIVGIGRAEKHQISFMIQKILSSIPKDKKFTSFDETDALAVAIATVI